MNTVSQAHAAGARDGKEGLGPLPPRKGPPGSLAHQLHAAYMQSYRDALVARVGLPERRHLPRNRNTRLTRRKTRTKRAPRGKAATARGKTVTTVTNSKVVRRTNPRPSVVLYATKPGMRRMKYLGRGKFGEHGRAYLFKSQAYAQGAAWVMKDTHPAELRGWTLAAK